MISFVLISEAYYAQCRCGENFLSLGLKRAGRFSETVKRSSWMLVCVGETVLMLRVFLSFWVCFGWSIFE